MSTVNLTQATFAETINAGGLVLVDLWAEWCGPCKRFAPVFEKVSEEHPDAVFAKVDTEAEQALAGELVFRDGILLFNQAGALPEAALEDLVGQAEALDMDEVRAELAAAES